MPPIVALLLMTGVSQVLAIEQALGVTAGHDTTVSYIDDAIAPPRGDVARKAPADNTRIDRRWRRFSATLCDRCLRRPTTRIRTRCVVA